MSTDASVATESSRKAAPLRPGKIIAVHLNFISRAEQRGRRPAHPSYFFKPSSSVGSSGGNVERPAGTELLAYEGEVALVIGTYARRVAMAEAWNHVRAVTAANDFGLYDLRANDKGSNVRSKGRDGYTPLGPELIDARTVDPTGLRIRTWVNGALVQRDRTDRLLFSCEQLISDLSQHFTLEPGDVILTGTPAGSSVVARSSSGSGCRGRSTGSSTSSVATRSGLRSLLAMSISGEIAGNPSSWVSALLSL